MKYTVNGFSQRGSIEAGLDYVDTGILRWIMDFSPNMKKHIEDGVQYVWVKHQYFIEQMPILGIGTRQGFSKRLDKLVAAGFVRRTFVKKLQCTECYVTLTDKVGQLTHDNHGLPVDSSHVNDGLRVHVNAGLRNSSINSNSSINTPLKAPPPENGKAKKKKATRLWQEFTEVQTPASFYDNLPDEWKQWAKKSGMNDERTKQEATKFWSYFVGEKPGQDVNAKQPAKLNWYQAWQGWINRSSPVQSGTPGRQGRSGIVDTAASVYHSRYGAYDADEGGNIF